MKARMTGLLVLVLMCAGAAPFPGSQAWGPAVALAQTDDVSAAQTLYDQGSYAQAATTIREGLSSGRIFGNRVVSARELLARCLVKTGQTANARRMFLQILEQDPLYRPDPLRVPPDEMAVFNQAKREFDASQQRAEQRLPASIQLYLGAGSGDNKDFGKFVAAGGGDSKYKNKTQFGIIVRFAVAPRFSLDLQLEHFEATNHDTARAGINASYKITAIPAIVSVSYLLHDSERFRAYAFVGGGPMLETTSSVDFLLFPGLPIGIADSKVGTYLHGGLEGEYRVHPRFSIVGRVLGRSAKATGLFGDTDFTPYDPNVSIKGRDVDFSGFAATIGVRAYVGY